jgi:hypothetical protein
VAAHEQRPDARSERTGQRDACSSRLRPWSRYQETTNAIAEQTLDTIVSMLGGFAARAGKGQGLSSRRARRSYQGSEMLTHQALEMLKRRTGLTKAR